MTGGEIKGARRSIRLHLMIGLAVVGVLAALWPGVRAARTRPLAAIAEG